VRVLVTSPKWWGRHLLVVLAMTVCAFLGRWQWDKAMYGSGDLINLGYGLQWWSFAAIILFGWYRLVRDTLHPRPLTDEEYAEAEGFTDFDQAETFDPTGELDRPAVLRSAPAPRVLRASRRPVEDPGEPDDPELAAYNAYLARLSARAGRS
jgi:DNA-binding transcriptional regulator of glucitol operon